MTRTTSFVTFALWAATATAVFGQSATPAPAPAPAPVPAVQLGFEERIRTENWDNIIDHNELKGDLRHQWRFRTRVWANIPLGNMVTFAVGLNNESKKQTGSAELPLVRDETIFETLYVDLKPTKQLSARIGRQNIMKGDGFILFDGTSGDGSRTAYMNAAVVGYAFSPKAKIELLAIDDPSLDDILPIITDKQKRLTEWNERLGGVYYTDTRHKGTDVQAYYLYKKSWNDYRALTSAQHQPDRHTSTMGARVAQTVKPGFVLTGEFAEQWGTRKPSTDIRAWAGYANAKYTFNHPWKPAVLFGFTGMSGDDPSSSNYEQWDPVMSRWPKWSELYIYSQVPEVGVAYWTNIGMWQGEVTAAPTKKLGLRGTYYHLTAFHPFPGSASTFSNGKNRGNLYQARLDYTYSPMFKGHVLYERLTPGNFYTFKDPGYFFRVEFIYTFTKSFPIGRAGASAKASTPTK